MSFIVCIKAEDIYKDITEDAETRFDTSNYELDRSLPKGKNKRVIELMKYKSGGKIMIQFVGFRAKTYSYLIDDDSEDKKAKGTKKCAIKRKLKSESYKNSLETTQKKKYLQKNKINIESLKKNHKKSIRNNKCERHNVFTKEISKIALCSIDDERMQSNDLIETYAYETSKVLVIEKEETKCSNIIKQYKK